MSTGTKIELALRGTVLVGMLLYWSYLRGRSAGALSQRSINERLEIDRRLWDLEVKGGKHASQASPSEA